MQLLDEKSLFLVRKELTLNDITQFTQSFEVKKEHPMAGKKRKKGEITRSKGTH